MLTVTDLTCARGGVPILSGVTFSVASGRSLILRGPNGAGKTTLLRTLAGLQPALTGSVEPGVDAIAYAGHADGLKSALSVAENLTFWAGVFGTRGIDAALSAFQLDALRDRAAAHLSAGQKRRLGLARLLVTGRPVWVLDEPTVSLDVASVARFGAVLATHLAGGGTAVIATHVDLGFDAEMLDIAAFRARAGSSDFDRSDFDEAFL